MPLINIVKKTDIYQGDNSRLDPESFNSQSLEWEKEFQKQGERLSYYTNRTTSKKIDKDYKTKFKQSDYLSISDIDARDGSITPELLDSDSLPSRAKWVLEYKDIVVSTVRPNRGGVSFIPSFKSNKIIGSSGLYPIFASQLSHEDAALLFAFMRTKYAREQLVRRSRNSMYPTVSPEDIESIFIPNFPDKVKTKLSDIYKDLNRIYKLWDLSKKKQSDHFDKIMGNLKFPPSPVHSERLLDTKVIDRSLAFGLHGAQRIDAEFFRDEYIEFEENITKIGSVTLDKYFNLITGRKVTGKSLIPIIKQNILTNYGPNYSNVEYEPAKPGAGIPAYDGDILLACTAHEVEYVGKKAELIRDLPAHLANNQVVGEIMILRAKENFTSSKSFIVDFLRSPYGTRQVQRCIRGVRGGHTYPADLGKYVKIPIMTQEDAKEYDEISKYTDTLRTEITRKTDLLVSCAEKYLDNLFVY